MTQPLPIAKASHELCLLPGFANRHGLITGAMNPKLKERIDKLAPGDFAFSGCPTVFWDVYRALGFSAKAILIKLAYAHPVDAAALLTLRLLFSAPFFVLMALWSKRDALHRVCDAGGVRGLRAAIPGNT